jgi:hypothetical protein
MLKLRQSGGAVCVMGRPPRPPSLLLGAPCGRPLSAAVAAAATAAPTEPASSTPQRQPEQHQQQPRRPPPSEQEEKQDVPSTLPGLLRAFFSEPSILGASALIAATATARLSLPAAPFSIAEPALCLAAAALWSLSEWVIHRHLLHPSAAEDGKPLDPLRDALWQTHEQHHTRPYLHLSVDGPGLIAAFMLGTGLLWLVAFWIVCGGIEFSSSAGGGAGLAAATPLLSNPLLLSALTSYWLSGLFYEFIHCAVHTRYVPKGNSAPARYLRSVRRHHILHHCRSEDHWLAFTVPQVDALFGTLPDSSQRLPAMTPMARRAAESWRRNGGGGGGGGGGE